VLKKDYGRLLSRHTSLKIGGPAFCWLEPDDSDDVLEAISVAEQSGKALTVIGGASNILARDKGFDGVVINLGRGFDYIEIGEDAIARVGSACPVSRLVKGCAELGLAGCEFLSGIPGSFGGALFMNAGVREIKEPERKLEIKDIILDIDVIDLRDKKKESLDRRDIDFRYRSSGLDGKCILGARIRLKKDKRSDIDNRVDSFMKRREWIQRLGLPSAGSVFKNPDPRPPAGILIEECGLKGKRIGGAEISRAHANFIVNTGQATSRDVLDLIELAQARVKEKFGIELGLELRII